MTEKEDILVLQKTDNGALIAYPKKDGFETTGIKIRKAVADARRTGLVAVLDESEPGYTLQFETVVTQK